MSLSRYQNGMLYTKDSNDLLGSRGTTNYQTGEKMVALVLLLL